ncbi:chymotrypsin-2-like [Atheta coriaria]|uniref:chymotrypsin-2-like n=1 Tax=Dalotia coriaria TaxID=877792 RepID=UPI0031F45236
MSKQLGTIILVVVLACESQAQRKIFRGVDIDITQAPYQISFQYYNKTTRAFIHGCGGSIIAPTWILTAGHCVHKVTLNHIKNKEIKMIVGMTKLSEPGISHQIKNVTIHNNYQVIKNPGPIKSKYTINDIALIELTSPIEYTDRAQPIHLPSDNDLPRLGTQCQVQGWGLINIDTKPDHLQSTTVKILDSDSCTFEWMKMINLQKSGAPYICAMGDKNNRSCRGDSGGALVCNGVQNGIVAYGSATCTHTPVAPSAFTDVLLMRDFISGATNNEVKF